jgi:hypothetical protein
MLKFIGRWWKCEENRNDTEQFCVWPIIWKIARQTSTQAAVTTPKHVSMKEILRRTNVFIREDRCIKLTDIARDLDISLTGVRSRLLPMTKWIAETRVQTVSSNLTPITELVVCDSLWGI